MRDTVWQGRVAEADHEQWLVAFDDSEAFRSKLHLKNRLVAYVFLVDTEKRVRWRGCGYALDHEIKAMCAAADALNDVRSGNQPRKALHKAGHQKERLHV